MKRLLLALLIALALLPLAAEAQPLSFEEARAYVAAFPEAAAEDVLALDAIERAVPDVVMPAQVFIFSEDHVGTSWAGPLEIRIADRLTYTIHLSTASARAPRPPWWPYLAAAGGGVLAGMLAANALR